MLKGIDKGDIVSSGAPQISKDGSTGRSSVEFPLSRRSKHGSHSYQKILILYAYAFIGVLSFEILEFSCLSRQ